MLPARRRRARYPAGLDVQAVSALLAALVILAIGASVWRWLAPWPAATIPPTAIAFFRPFLAQPSIGGRHRPPRVTLAWTLLAYLGLVYGAVVAPIHDTNWFMVPFGIYVFGGLY